MKYKAKNGNEYVLIESEVILRGGKIAKVYYFVDEITQKNRKLKECKALPKGYEIHEVSKSGGHPLVRKVKNETTQ